MNNILYNKKILTKYDPDFKDSYLFTYELNENDCYKLVKHTRKVIGIHNYSRYIYLSTLDIKRSDFGVLLSSSDCLINLSKIGDNIYFLSYLENKNKLAIYSILHTFIALENCYIDVSKYSYLFEDSVNLYLHQKTN